jgi:hypothetical protein
MGIYQLWKPSQTFDFMRVLTSGSRFILEPSVSMLELS